MEIMYYQSPSGAITNQNGDLIQPNDNNPLWLEYVEFLNNDGVLELTSEEPLEILDAFRDQTILEAYEKRKIDGWNAYQQFRKDMVKEIYDGHLTKPAAFMIEEYLGVGYDKIAQNGDWETAYYKLSQIVLPEAHSFVQPYLNTAKAIMLSYIQQNYRPM